MAIGQRLKQRRTEKGLTQAALAGSRYTPAYVSTIESGRRRPSRAAASYFARRLGIGIEELLGEQPDDVDARLHGELAEARRLLAAGDAPGAESLLARAAGAARDLGRHLIEMEALRIRGVAAELAGRPSEALELYEQAEELLRQDSPLLRVNLVAGRARCLHAQGDIRYAIHIVETLLRVLEENGLEDPSAVVRLHTSLVAGYFDLGLHERARRSADIAMELAPQVSDPERLGNMHINVARVLLEEGEAREAEASFRRAQEMFAALDWKNDLGRVHLASGFGLIEQDRIPEGRLQLERARSIFTETGDTVNELRAVLHLGRAASMAGELAEARELLGSVLSEAPRHAPSERGLAQRELAVCAMRDGRQAEVKGLLSAAIDSFEEAGDDRERAITQRLYGDLMRSQEDITGACDAYRAAALTLERAA